MARSFHKFGLTDRRRRKAALKRVQGEFKLTLTNFLLEHAFRKYFL